MGAVVQATQGRLDAITDDELLSGHQSSQKGHGGLDDNIDDHSVPPCLYALPRIRHPRQPSRPRTAERMPRLTRSYSVDKRTVAYFFLSQNFFSADHHVVPVAVSAVRPG